MKYMKKRRGKKKRSFEEDPMSGVANLFDVAMVFAVALLIALVSSYHIQELLDPTRDITIVKNPGQPDMQVIVKEGKEIKTLNVTEEMSEVEIAGTVGTIYRTPDGGMVYVPEGG
ncbi:MAG: hypothetical protein SCAL_000183 [Candidatus Syntrophoarchaeum caldarius]|uniref:DUF2149 domain-containing protein n=1 Tax=Candidatus Syntropharchaeum caldarium TaxID=1838285 RepID=A0A1F2PB26_9EURY|nr:MAG: hypothetical protein SCAL_000183 [Candidatus Syntrophoarchaeum caldarius]